VSIHMDLHASLTHSTRPDAARSDSILMKKFKQQTVVAPQERKKSLDEFIGSFSNPQLREVCLCTSSFPVFTNLQKAMLQKWNLVVNTKAIEVNARILPSAKLIMREAAPSGQERMVDLPINEGYFFNFVN
jgi:hypothetical protein